MQGELLWNFFLHLYFMLYMYCFSMCMMILRHSKNVLIYHASELGVHIKFLNILHIECRCFQLFRASIKHRAVTLLEKKKNNTVEDDCHLLSSREFCFM